MTALIATDVRKSYGQNLVLDGVDLTIAPGEICGLLGPNGAGKTTFASIVAGIRRPDSGTVEVGGIDVSERPFEARQLLGYAPQELGIYPLATVRENLQLFGELAGLRARTLAARIEEVAAALGLVPLLDRVAGRLSGGQQRRLHTAMALLHRPELVLLDEPTVGADVQTRTALLEFVRTLADDGVAVCYTTHYLQEVETLAASVALIDEGRILARGSVDDLVSAHSTTFLELRFDGPAPDLEVIGSAPSEADDVLLIPSTDPAADTARVMTALGPHSSRLRGIDIVRSSLESVFVELTGKRLSDESPEVVRAVG